jgi:hypothetical protein
MKSIAKRIGQAGAYRVRVPAIDMKNSPLATFLLVVGALSAVLSVIFCALYVSSTLQLRSLNAQVNFINNRSSAISGLVKEAVEYSTRNAAIDPILEGIGAKAPKSGSVFTNKPPAK